MAPSGEVCQDDGYLTNGLCESKWQQVPRDRHFAKATPHHFLVHSDETREYRVDSRCASVVSMKPTSWFVLPPTQKHYYRSSHSDYRPTPAYHPDCRSEVAGKPMDLLYPDESTVVYIPIDLDGESKDVVFEAVYWDSDATLHWHLDDRYIASPRSFHQLALRPEAGKHRLTLVDQSGRSLKRGFRVWGKSASRRERDRNSKLRFSRHLYQAFGQPSQEARKGPVRPLPGLIGDDWRDR